jgi:hypothetical protein
MLTERSEVAVLPADQNTRRVSPGERLRQGAPTEKSRNLGLSGACMLSLCAAMALYAIEILRNGGTHGDNHSGTGNDFAHPERSKGMHRNGLFWLCAYTNEAILTAARVA